MQDSVELSRSSWRDAMARLTTLVLYSSLFAGSMFVTGPSLAASLPDAPTPAVEAPAQSGQTQATVETPVQLLGLPVQVTAPSPISYTGSAYTDDVSGQSESNSDPAIAEGSRTISPNLPDAW